MTRWLAISPHFDDAVLSCGHLLAGSPGSAVLTVCGGIAGTALAISGWDAMSGFPTAESATSGRQLEDAEALRVLGAIQMTADLLDNSYRTYHRDDLNLAADAIRAAIDALHPDQIVLPLGIGTHEDHILARMAGLIAASEHPLPAYFYADLPYFIDRDPLSTAGGLGAEPAELPIVPWELVEQKAAALVHYRSQLRLLAQSFGSRFGEVFLPGVENIFRIADPSHSLTMCAAARPRPETSRWIKKIRRFLGAATTEREPRGC